MQDAFENWMDAKAREFRGEWFDAKAAGVTWDNADGSSRQTIARGLSEYDELELRPEPNNPFDKNAIALFTQDGLQVGYLEGRVAGEVTRRMNTGGSARCFVRAVRERGSVCGVSFGLLRYQHD